MKRLPPNQLQPSATEGDVLVTKNGRTQWGKSSGGAGPGGTQLVPLTTVLNGEPQLVWDVNNELVMTEARN